jgi:Domain of unknown function (DUF4349)/Putative zinc-finger
MKHEIAELLPFYANGTLDAAERVRVEAELATCATCAEELHELQALGNALQARAASAAPLPPHVFDDAIARIAIPPATAAVAKIRSAWWGTPARYATAATLVLGFGVAAAAAWHAHEAGVVGYGPPLSTGTDEKLTVSSVYRVTPGPHPAYPAKAARRAINPRTDAPATVAQAPAPQSVAKQHRLAKHAQIELLVRDVEGALRNAQSAVRGAGGDVTSLADASPRTSDVVHGATLTVEVPAERLEGTLDRLGLLGAVQNRRIDAEDVDAAIVDEEARLRNLRRAEADLRALMDKGGKVTDILTVQEKLGEVRGEIEQLDAQHKHDVHRVATSTIDVTLTEDRPNATPAKPGPSARIDSAWHNGVNALADTVIAFVSTAAWALAYSPVPLALIALAYGVFRLIGRRTASA